MVIAPLTTRASRLGLKIVACLFVLSATVAIRAAIPTWTPTGPMSVARMQGLPFLLPNGKVMLIGGSDAALAGASTDIYDPANGTWAFGPPPPSTHPQLPGGARLLDGRVLITGGRYDSGITVASADIYDPSTHTWTAARAMNRSRVGHTLTLLEDGRVLAAGGYNSDTRDFDSSAEIYNPASDSWAFTGAMSNGRWLHTATRLTDGRVMVIGGEHYTDPLGPHFRVTQIYSPVTGTWTAGPPLNAGRASHGVAMLPDGRLMVMGGISGWGTPYLKTTELFNGTAWQAGPPMAEGRLHFPVVEMSDGSVLVSGGTSLNTNPQTVTAGVERYVPATNAWTSSGLMNAPRRFHAMIELADGRVLVAGGQDGTAALGSSEVTGSDSVAPQTSAARSIAPNGNGWNNGNVTVTLESADNDGGSGLQSLVYSLAGAQSGGATIAGPTAAIVIATEGITTLTFHAVDLAGNVESDQTVVVRIDKTPPALDYQPNLTVGATAGGTVVNFNTSAIDGPSGVVSVTSAPLSSGMRFPAGTTTVQRTALDAAGNSALSSFTVTVVPSAPFVTVSGGIFAADGSAHPATAVARDTTGAVVAGVFTFSYAPGGAVAPSAPGNYSASAVFVSDDPGILSASTWETMAPDPDGKTSPGAVEINGRVYVHGFHRDPNGNQSSFAPRLSIYDPWLRTWTVGAAPSLVRAFANVATIGGKMYVVGGCLMSDCSFTTNALEIYDPVSGTWSTGAPMPTSRFGAAAGVIDGKLYVTGGSVPSYTPTNVTQVYDPVSNTWTTSTAIPVSRELAASAVVNGELYVIGGYQRGGVEAAVGRVDLFNPATGWSTRTAMPTARYGAAAGVIGPQIYVVGGTGASGLLATNESYDPLGNTWESAAPMGAARTYLTGAVAQSRLFIIDGFDGSPASVTTNEMFDPGLTAQIIVNSTFPSVSVSGSPNPSAYGQAVTLTATVARPNNDGPATPPTGSVTFTIDGIEVSVQPLVGGQASFTTNSLVATSCPPSPAQCFGHNVTVAYSGDNLYLPASQSTNQFVNQRQPASTLVSSPNPATVGQTVTFTATIADPMGFSIPTGIVAFTIDGNPAGSAGLVNGQASIVSSSMGAGSHNVSANYLGDLNFQPSSQFLNQTVTLPAPTLSISPTTSVKNSGATIAFSGTGAPGASISLWDGLNGFGGGIVVGASGTWSTTRSVDGILVGTRSVTAKQHSNGQTSGASPVVILHVRPPVPGISGPGAVSSSISPASVLLSGFGFYGGAQNPPTGATVSIFEGATQIGSAIVVSGGSWSATIFLGYGAHSLRASQTLGGETSDLSAPFTVMVSQPLTLLSISVTPASTATAVGETQQFQASGLFNDGQTRQLFAGGSGSGGGSGGNSTPTWNIHFTSSLNVGACAGGTTFSSQAVTPNSSGAVSTSWGSPNTVQVNGTVTAPTAPAPQVNLTLTCIPANGATGSLTASWTGTRYEGTATLSGTTVPVVLTGWSTKAPMPTAHWSFGAATVNGIVYAMGGGNPSLAQPVDAYDPATNAWTTVGQMQTSREGAAIAALGDKIYVAGGHVSGGAASGVFEVYDPAANSWLSLAAMPTARAHFALVAAGGKLYAMGGDTGPNNSATTAVVEQYDPETNQWISRASMTVPRNFFVAGALNSGATIVVAGGAGTGSSTELYNVAGNNWASGPSMQTQSVNAAAAVVNNALFVFGGGSSGNTVQMFRPVIGTLPTGWSVLGGMPTGRGALGAAAVGDVVYVLGGTANGQPLATAEAFSTPPPTDLSVSSGGSGSGGGGGSSSLPSVQWQSTNLAVATINSSGTATSTGPGQASIVASACPTSAACDVSARISGNATLTVMQPMSVTFVLAPGSLTPPSNQVTITLSQPPNPGTYTDTLTIGQPASVDQPGIYHIVFTVPVGYTLAQPERDVSINEGDHLSVPLLFGLVDTTPPDLVVPADLTVEATSASGTAVAFAAATATDTGSGLQSLSCNWAPGDTFPLAITTVSCSATDNNGNTATASFTVTVVDTTAPTLSLPDTVTTDATSPSGAVVTYAASASDAVGVASVVCSPASGSTFPIGTTVVSCTATDGAGLSATGGFEVLVQAAAAQVGNLANAVQSFNLAQGIENSLDAKLQNILDALSAAQTGQVANVCGQLGAFVNQTAAQSGKQLTVAQADQLSTAARRIQAVIGCP